MLLFKFNLYRYTVALGVSAVRLSVGGAGVSAGAVEAVQIENAADP
jgi:hypothetical protein